MSSFDCTQSPSSVIATTPARLSEPIGASAARAVWEGLVARRVLVRDFSAWPGVEGCLRVTVGTRAENDAFLAALGSVVRESGVR